MGAGLVWRQVPAGPFRMGSDPAAAYPPDEDESPRHVVRLEGFRLSRLPVTSSQYGEFLESTDRPRPAAAAGGDDVPLTYVGWGDACAFCDWAGVRLPTEAEWEAAAGGGESRLWPWGDEPPDATRARFSAGIGAPVAGGGYPAGASPAGVLDLAGNVSEWVSSAYRPYPYDPSDGRESPATAGPRVVRGGSYLSGADELRCSHRSMAHPGARDHYIGFRVVEGAGPSRIAFDWVDTPGGEFAIGRDPVVAAAPARADELPPHVVELPAYELSLTPVTNAQYASFVRDGGAVPPPHWDGASPSPGLEAHPVTFVDWFDAVAFCEWEGGRLPTEAEWEKGARGLDGRLYPWGAEEDASRAVIGLGMKRGTTAPVGSLGRGASPFRLLDMTGNVWEWVSSAHRAYPYDPDDGREEAAAAVERVLRGGSYASPGLELGRCAMRSHSRPERRQSHIGFRVARGVR